MELSYLYNYSYGIKCRMKLQAGNELAFQIVLNVLIHNLSGTIVYVRILLNITLYKGNWRVRIAKCMLRIIELSNPGFNNKGAIIDCIGSPNIMYGIYVQLVSSWIISGLGALVIFSGVPVYLLCIAWKNKPRCVKTGVGMSVWASVIFSGLYMKSWILDNEDLCVYSHPFYSY